MPRDYFHCLYRFRGSERWLIWFADDVDGVVADDQFGIPTFESAEALENAFSVLVGGRLVIGDSLLHDLDLVESRCRTDQLLDIDCPSFLAAWNLFIDVAHSVGDRGTPYLDSDKALNGEYEKLFFGNNLPAVTPPGQHYTPCWSAAEIDAIRRHLILGFYMFEAVTYAHGRCGGLFGR